jgi:organic radical activating enzyme
MASELKVSEIFDSLQGEGPSTGAPATFLRLALCNLKCRFCDTAYTWDFERFRYEDEVSLEPVDALVERLRAACGRRLIVTGGEPLVQWKALERLFERLPADLTIEVETNGTLCPSDRLLARVNQWNVSPKLENSGESLEDRLNEAALAVLRDSGRAYLKLVVGSVAEAAEAERLAAELEWPRDRVQLMPLAATREELSARSGLVAREALARGLRFSSRLHVELWGGRRGV